MPPVRMGQITRVKVLGEAREDYTVNSQCYLWGCRLCGVGGDGDES